MHLFIKSYGALLVTSYCDYTEKSVGLEKVGGITHRVLCTWQQLGSAVKRAMVGTK